jgi:hypothetical protein
MLQQHHKNLYNKHYIVQLIQLLLWKEILRVQWVPGPTLRPVTLRGFFAEHESMTINEEILRIIL